MKFTVLWVLFFITAYQSLSKAAPHPGVGSSALADPLSYRWLLNKRYSLKLPTNYDAQWSFLEQTQITRLQMTTKKNNEDLIVSVAYEPSSKFTSKPQDYLNLGFELLASKNFKHEALSTQVFDLHHRGKNRQMRQFIINNGKGTLTLTCSSEAQSFPRLIKPCTDIYQSLRLTE